MLVQAVDIRPYLIPIEFDGQATAPTQDNIRVKILGQRHVGKARALMLFFGGTRFDSSICRDLMSVPAMTTHGGRGMEVLMPCTVFTSKY